MTDSSLKGEYTAWVYVKTVRRMTVSADDWFDAKRKIIEKIEGGKKRAVVRRIESASPS